MRRTIYLLAAEADLSFDEIRERLCDALVEQFGRDIDGCPRFYLYETFPDYVIARGPDGMLFRVSYTLAPDDVNFGEAQQVETAYVPVSEACSFLATEADAATSVDGVYPIVALKAGWGNGVVGGEGVPHYYPPAFVKQVAEALDGAPFGRKHPDQRSPDPTGSTDASRIAGYLEGGSFQGIEARSAVKLFTAESDLRSRLDEARSAKRLGLFGVSMLASIGFKPGVVDGKQCLIAESLAKLYSVDLCQRAGAGGQFLAAASFAGTDFAAAQLAAVKPNTTTFAPRNGRGGNQGGATKPTTRGARMNKTLQQLLDSLRKKDPAKAGDFYSRLALATEAEQEAIQGEVITALGDAPAATTTTIAAEAAATLAEAQRANTRGRIEAKLTESKLPEPAKGAVRRTLDVMLATEANLSDEKIDGEISATRTAFAAVAGATRVVVAGVSLDSHDKLALAMESMLGVESSKNKGVPAFRGLKDAYVQITGDYNLDKLASSGGRLLVSEAAGTAIFPNLTLDAMHKRLLQEWAELKLDGLQSLYTTAIVTDYKQQNRVRDGFFPELPIVGEGVDYLEMTYPTDERVSYAVQKRGGLLSITEEMIRNDDLGAVARWPGKMARAARWGLRNYITSFLANNQVYGADNLAWFHANHNNLLALPFGQDGLIQAQLQLRRQTEKDSGEPLGLPLNWIAVPPELEAAAVQLNQTNTAGSNAFYQRFGANNERIFINEKFADTNDWYYGTDQNYAPFLEIGFLDGKEDPEIFLANQPTVGQQFLADEIQYKVKFVYNGAILDYRGVGKSVNP